MKVFVRSKHYRDRYMRYSAGLVLYYYALYRLLQSKPVSDLFMKLIPVRKEGGSTVRDRRRQIGFLLEKDELYHQKYFQFIKKLFPVALKQLEGIASALGVRNLIFPGSGGGINKNSYLRLLADVVQDTLNSGLGILSGQRFNDASREMEKGARMSGTPCSEENSPYSAGTGSGTRKTLIYLSVVRSFPAAPAMDWVVTIWLYSSGVRRSVGSSFSMKVFESQDSQNLF